MSPRLARMANRAHFDTTVSRAVQRLRRSVEKRGSNPEVNSLLDAFESAVAVSPPAADEAAGLSGSLASLGSPS